MDVCRGLCLLAARRFHFVNAYGFSASKAQKLHMGLITPLHSASS